MRFQSIYQTALALLGGTNTDLTTTYSPNDSNVNNESSPHECQNHVIKINSSTWDDTAWTLTSHAPINVSQGHYQSRLTLANGYTGLSVAYVGPFFEFDTPTFASTRSASAASSSSLTNGDDTNEFDVDENAISGWPLFTKRQTFGTIAGFYANLEHAEGTNYEWLNQYGWESLSSGIPHWSGLLLEVDGCVLDAGVDAAHVDDFTSTLDVAQGEARWNYVWRPCGKSEDAINVEYGMFVHKLHVNRAAVRVRLEAVEKDVEIKVYDVLDGTGAVRTESVEQAFETEDPTIWTAVSPQGLPEVKAYVYSTLQGNELVDLGTREQTKGATVFGSTHQASIGQAVKVTLQAGQTAEVAKHIGIASSDAFSDPQQTARQASVESAAAGYEELFISHAEEWKSILSRHTVDSYHNPDGSLPKDRRLQEMQITSVTNPFMILQNTIGPNAIAAADDNALLNIHSIPVCGLGSDCYGGLIFWDAETWMALGLQVSHPDHIESVVNYRVQMYPQAKENVKMAYTSSKNQTGRFTGGAVFPWTSARYGNCTGTGPCFDYEYHVNGDIAISLRNQYIVTGNAQRYKEVHLPIANDIAYFYGEMVDYNATSGFYEIWNATDPDEYANNKNNVGFTTALIQKHFEETNEMNARFGLPINTTWLDMTPRMRLPINHDVGIVLEYDTMNGSIVVKQADVVLTDDILHYDNPYSLRNLDYYANKQSPDGPGMTYATFSIVANEVSPSGCSSFTYALYSQRPYLRLPWFQYSEQMSDDVSTNGGTHPAFPFLTGMGGSNRIGISGYLGLRLYVDKLEVDPSLPPQIEHLNYRTFYWQGYGIDASSNATHTTLRRMPDHILSTADPKYLHAPIPVSLGIRGTNYTLSTSSPLTIPNRMVGQTATVARNILQCAPIIVSSDSSPISAASDEDTTSYLPGQFPMAAIDGASSTKWQPYNASRTNYLTVDLGPSTRFHPIQAVLLDWGAEPPAYYEVLFSNHSLPPFSPSTASPSNNKNGDAVHGNDGDIRRIAHGPVHISEPWDPDSSFAILPIKGNQTNVTLAARDVWTGRYAHLGIRGRLDYGDSGDLVGASVAEWSVVRWRMDGEGYGRNYTVLGGVEVF